MFKKIQDLIKKTKTQSNTSVNEDSQIKEVILDQDKIPAIMEKNDFKDVVADDKEINDAILDETTIEEIVRTDLNQLYKKSTMNPPSQSKIFSSKDSTVNELKIKDKLNPPSIKDIMNSDIGKEKKEVVVHQKVDKEINKDMSDIDSIINDVRVDENLKSIFEDNKKQKISFQWLYNFKNNLFWIKRNFKKTIKKNYLFFYVVFIPFMIFSVYQNLLAKDRFVSDASIVVQNIGSGEQSLGLSALLTGVSGNTTNDLLVIKEYIQSSDMMEEVDKKISILNHWNKAPDLLYKLWTPEYREKALDYYRSKVKAKINTESGSLQIIVETFDAQTSKNMLDMIVKKSEDFVNKNAHLSANEQLNFVKQKIQEDKNYLDQIRKDMLTFKNDQKILTPGMELEQKTKKIIGLEEEKFKIEQDLALKRNYLSEESPQIISLKNLLSQIANKIENEKIKQNNSNKSERTLNHIADEYKMIEQELNIRSEAYKGAVISYEKLKIEVSRKLKQVILITQPKVADYPIYPERFLSVFYFLIIQLVIFGILSLLKGIIKEHK